MIQRGKAGGGADETGRSLLGVVLWPVGRERQEAFGALKSQRANVLSGPADERKAPEEFLRKEMQNATLVC